MPARGVDSQLMAQGGLERVFGDTLPLLAGSDLVLGNLEGAATRRGEKASKSFTFRFEPAALGSLARAGFSYLSLTNNHTFDYGDQGFIDSLAALSAAGIATSGAGLDEEQAWKTADLAAGDTPVRIISFGAYPVDRTGFDGRRTARAGRAKPGILWLDEQGIARAAALFSPGTLDVVMIHGGEEWTRLPTVRQRELYGGLLHAGADVVIGSHSHVLQPVEAVGGGLAAWSLGNFLFPGMEGTPGGEDSAILRLGVFAGAVRYVQLVPVRLKGTTVRLTPGPR
jgi:poly-gamma-glutamate synthesis protein (capsule biosynthesis protein)